MGKFLRIEVFCTIRSILQTISSVMGCTIGLSRVFNISRITKGTFWTLMVTNKGGIFINYFDKLLLIDELSKVANEGTKLYINDELTTPEVIAQICMEDTAVYMPDYVVDRFGTLVEIRFDKVEDC